LRTVVPGAYLICVVMPPIAVTIPLPVNNCYGTGLLFLISFITGRSDGNAALGRLDIRMPQ
jgi:hypothetical protein